MSDRNHSHPKLAYDGLIVGVGLALLVLMWGAGLRGGQPIVKGFGTVLGGLYTIYIGFLFLFSYFLSDTAYILSFLRYICEECTRGQRGRHMAFVYFALGLGVGTWLLLTGLGVL